MRSIVRASSRASPMAEPSQVGRPIDAVFAGLTPDQAGLMRYLLFTLRLEPSTDGWTRLALDCRYPRDSNYDRKLVAERYALWRDRLLATTDLYQVPLTGTLHDPRATHGRGAGLTHDEAGLGRRREP